MTNEQKTTNEVSAPKIPARGPFSVPLPDGGRVEVWYERDHARMWCVQVLDAEGNQTGPGHDRTAEYEHRRERAVTLAVTLYNEAHKVI